MPIDSLQRRDVIFEPDTFFNIEDDVVVTKNGVENLNANLSRELRVKM